MRLTPHATDNDISVNIIDTPDYNAFSQCTFYTDGEKTLVQSIGDNGEQQIVVGPPQPIRSVSCQGMCVPTYGKEHPILGCVFVLHFLTSHLIGMCYDTNGQYVGPCCNGFCAATRCRPWDISTG